MKPFSSKLPSCVLFRPNQSFATKICYRQFKTTKPLECTANINSTQTVATQTTKPITPEMRFNLTLWNHIQAKRYKDAEQMFGEAVHKNHPLNPTTFNNMIVCMLRQNKIPQVETLRQEMLARGFRVFPKTVVQVMTHFANLGDVFSVMQWLEQLKITRLPIDRFHINSLLVACSQSGRTSDLLQHFLDWSETVPYDESIFNTVLTALAQDKHVAGIETVLELAIKWEAKVGRGGFFKAFIAVSTLGHKQALENLYRMMPALGIEPDVSVFISLMTASKFDHEQLKMYWEEMKKCNIHPNIITWSLLLDSYQKQGDYAGCIKYWNELLDSKLELSTPIVNIMISTFAKMGDTQKVNELFESFEKWNLKRSEVTYLCMIKFYSRISISQAAALLERMKREGLEPTQHRDFRTLIKKIEKTTNGN